MTMSIHDNFQYPLKPPFPWSHRHDVLAFQQLLDEGFAPGTQARLVGGAVRDAILGIEAKDIDIATPLRPETVKQISEKAGLTVIPTGIDHGTVTILLANGSVEVTTLRRDVSTDGRHATVAFSDDWKEDAARRDFTFNAFYAEPESGKLYDYYDGLRDLKAGRVRFIGNAQDRILEDHLRIMRFFRFHAYLGSSEVDGETLAICQKLAPRMQGLSRERVSQELQRLLMAPDPVATLVAMYQSNITNFIVPGITTEGIANFSKVIKLSRDQNIPADGMTRLASLLNSRNNQPTKIAAKLRLSRKQKEQLNILWSTDPKNIGDILELAYYHGRDQSLQIALISGDSDLLAAAKHALADWQKPVFPIGGRDILALGIEQGPHISKLLQAAEKKWLADGCPDIQNIPDYIRNIAKNT